MDYALDILSTPSRIRRVIAFNEWGVASIEVWIKAQFWVVIESVAGFFCDESSRTSVEHIGILVIEGLCWNFFNNSSGGVTESFL